MSEVASKAAFTLGGFFFCYDQPWIFDLPLPFCGVQFLCIHGGEFGVPVVCVAVAVAVCVFCFFQTPYLRCIMVLAIFLRSSVC